MRKIKKDQRMKRQQEGEGRMRKREQMIKREGPDSDKEDRKRGLMFGLVLRSGHFSS